MTTTPPDPKRVQLDRVFKRHDRVVWTRGAADLHGTVESVLDLGDIPDCEPKFQLLIQVMTPDGLFYEYPENLALQ